MKKTQKRNIIIISISAAVAIAAAGIYSYLNRGPNSDYKYDNVSDVLESANEVLDNKYDRFTLPEKIDVETTKNAYIITTAVDDDQEDVSGKIKKISDKMFGMMPDDIELDEEHGERWKAETVYNGEYVDFTYYPSGTFSFGFFYNTELLTLGAEKTYLLGSDETEGEVYKLKDGEMSVDEAVDMAYDYINGNLMEFLPNNSDVKPVAVSVFKANEDDYCYCVKLENVIEGIPVSGDGTAIPEEYTLFPQVQECWIYRTDRVEAFWNNYYRYIGEKEKVKKIITLESAIENLDKELAPNLNYNFLNISLKYCCRTENNNAETFEYRPTWCFVTASYNTTDAVINPCDIIFVDAVSGEIYSYDGKNGTFLF